MSLQPSEPGRDPSQFGGNLADKQGFDPVEYARMLQQDETLGARGKTDALVGAFVAYIGGDNDKISQAFQIMDIHCRNVAHGYEGNLKDLGYIVGVEQAKKIVAGLQKLAENDPSGAADEIDRGSSAARFGVMDTYFDEPGEVGANNLPKLPSLDALRGYLDAVEANAVGDAKGGNWKKVVRREIEWYVNESSATSWNQRQGLAESDNGTLSNFGRATQAGIQQATRLGVDSELLQRTADVLRKRHDAQVAGLGSSGIRHSSEVA